MKIIAYIRTDLPEKFGIPRQSGLAGSLEGKVVFEPEYRNPEAFRGLEGFDYIWLLWRFDAIQEKPWSPTVRPPRLGGNQRRGVFATRSPFRPNAIGLSSVRLEGIEYSREYGPVLHVSGVDLMDGTAIYDVKPYLKYVDSHEDARDGFAEDAKRHCLEVEFPQALLVLIPPSKRAGILELLSQDPRPGYHKDPRRQYGVSYAGFNVKFAVEGQVLKVYEVNRL